MSAQPIHDLDAGGQFATDTQTVVAPGVDPSQPDEATSRAPTSSSPPRQADPSDAGGQGEHATHGHFAPGVDPSQPDGELSRSDARLAIYADALDDFQRVRIATDNRLRALNQVKCMGDTIEAGRMRQTSDTLAALEHGVTLELKRVMRKHPLGPWVKAQAGVGEKQAARLLASIGDPATRANPAQLWAYCGYVPGQRRQKGVKSNWSAVAKSQAYLIAESCTKQTCTACRRQSAEKKANGDGTLGWTPPPADCTCADVSPYRAVYDQYRVAHAESVHTDPCAQCGPAGKPAQPGSPLSMGHRKARAVRYVAKRILRDLWREARRVQSDPTP